MTHTQTLSSETSSTSSRLRLLKRLGLGLGGLAALLVGVGLLLPSQYQVERSLRITADVEAVHALVGDLEQWDAWTPWKENDPTVVVTLGDETTGVGASQSWTSEHGPGQLTFTACSLDGVEYELSFGEGDDCRSLNQILYTREPGAVVVTWRMSGDVGLDLIGRYLVLTMDSCVGPYFEQGLAKLKALVEAERKTAHHVVGERLLPLPAERAPH